MPQLEVGPGPDYIDTRGPSLQDITGLVLDLEPPPKKRKYTSGGPGRGNRNTQNAGDVADIATDMTPATYPRARPRASRGGRRYQARTPATAYTRRNRRAPMTARNRETSTADAAASHLAQSNDNKPREERGWEEYHPNLDIDASLALYTADEVDGRVRPTEAINILEKAAGDGQLTPTAKDFAQADKDSEVTPTQKSMLSGPDVMLEPIITPVKRRPGRPPRNPQMMLHGLGSPPTPRIEPLPLNNKDEKLRLTKAIFRPVSTYEKFETSKEYSAKNFVDKTLSSFGYQETDRVLEPDRYDFVRGGEGSIEEELDLQMAQSLDEDKDGSGAVMGRVEYDMDEQDEFWLEEINARRKDDQLEAIKPAHFEVTMTQIEKEWHALEKRIPKHNPKSAQTRPRSSSAAAVVGEQETQEDQACAICDDGDCDNSNAILFCDGCDLAVHQECYGVPFVPEGQWLCRKCQHYGRTSPRCVFCPHTDGAFKQTTNSKWAHLLCAIWIPEISLGNAVFMEPIMDVEKVPKGRWSLRCYICQQKWGACIQCGNKNCYQAFHVTCARKAKLFLKMKAQHGGPDRMDASALKAYCDRHVPVEWKRENDVPMALAEAKDYFREQFRGMRWGDAQNSALVAAAAEQSSGVADTSEALGASKRKADKSLKNVWRLPSGAPVAPHVLFAKVEASLVRFAIRKRKEFAADACKYWTLKREARRGAALLKRLQMQRDTYTTMDITRRNFVAMGAIGRVRLHNRINFAGLLETDMDKILELCKLVLDREREKVEDMRVLRQLVESTYFPLSPRLWDILDKAQQLDAGAKDEGPKYFKFGLKALQDRLEQRYYISVTPLCSDIVQVISTAILTTTSDDVLPEHETRPTQLSAKRKEIKKVGKRILSRIKDMVLETQRIEAVLGGRPSDFEPINLEEMLESSLRARQGSSAPSMSGGLPVVDIMSPLSRSQINAGEGMEVDPGHEFDDASKHQLLNGDSIMVHAPVAHANAQGVKDRNETTEEAMIRAQLQTDTETYSIKNSGEIVGSMKQLKGVAASSSSSTATAPALSVTGSTNPSTHPIEPYTPPDHTNEHDSLVNDTHRSIEGGVPWYLERFEPCGTTIFAEVDDDITSIMSSDLSELGDEDVDSLMPADIREEAAADEARKRGLERKRMAARKRRKLGWGG